jgi:hypothetical protein
MAGPAPGAVIAVYLGYILAAEEGVKIIAITEHREAIRPIAVADVADERGLESPDGIIRARIRSPCMVVSSTPMPSLWRIPLLGN